MQTSGISFKRDMAFFNDWELFWTGENTFSHYGSNRFLGDLSCDQRSHFQMTLNSSNSHLRVLSPAVLALSPQACVYELVTIAYYPKQHCKLRS